MNLTQRGYACYPVNITLDQKGEKEFHFPGKWQTGEYPTEPDAIAAHWGRYSGLVVNTERSGVVVVDFDLSKGKDGFTALTEAGIELPDTPVKVKTWSGGEHWYYRVGKVPVASSQSKLAAGVDIRAAGGIAVAPPTPVGDAGKYRFTGKVVPVSELPEFPPELAELLKPRESKVKTTDSRPALSFEQRQRMQGMMDRILRDLRTMGDGTRNATMRLRLIRLYGISMTLGEDLYAVGELVREAYFESGGTAEQELEAFITWAEEHARYELPDDETDEHFEAEVAAIIRRVKAQEEAKARLSPVKVTRVSDEDILEFDPDEADDDWLIRGLLPKGETVILFGTPNAGKSFAAVDLCMGHATGIGAWGDDVEQGTALYLAGEGTRRLSVRRRAWELFHEKEPGADVQFRKMRLILSSDESVAEHQALVKRLRPSLIIVDTMMRASEGLVLENPGEASRAIAQLDRVREASPGATLVVLHHPAKSNPDEPAGSYPIKGNVDTVLSLATEGGIRTISVNKSRDDDKSWKKSFELKDIAITGTRLSSAVMVPSITSPRWQASPWDE
ncbi:AAA family ATPase [Amycolatopsis japonica]|uniref:AAA family ATPase n=1 Tax=Amycolatopsis japonica TaxID=208439 RepID=UPI00130DC1D1|nr:AAA family ATPase [Amycolatopsis japonica]